MAKTIGTELKRLLNKLGGTPSKYDQTNELIHKITDQVESGGGGLQTIKPVIGEFVQDSSSKGHCSFTVTGLKYGSLYLLDFDFVIDVAPLIPSPSEDWSLDQNENRVFLFDAAPVWYAWNSNNGALMASILDSEQRANNENMSQEEGETFTANIVFKHES